MDECIDSFGKATVFSALDGNSEYRHMVIDEKERDKTAVA